ncbi:hypothetical protein BS47DRAFT_1485913 [Hydnum rufescens UP504]|uniref:RING-type domain-containing protein n=1 Tax=Hydnum rufescens UP504 TaxID=1448309 RepID=A0A9P6DVV3_9AGAM|nr:hypothetical protein BS47DRAFT_1485913 [Hydnum rufescens UP504]
MDSEMLFSQGKHPREEEDATDDERDASPSKKLSLSSDLSCGICLSLLTHPYSVIPCLHTFDKGCLTEWWKSHGTCPLCKTGATSARHSFQLNAIIHHYNHVKRRRIPDPTPDGTRSSAASPDPPASNEIIYPLGAGPPGSFVGDGICNGPVWPCPSCIPGNTTGHTCPIPIPSPSDVPPFPDGSLMPARGERRASLFNVETGEYRSPGADQHRHCSTCTTYLPVGLPIQCAFCGVYNCSGIDPLGCPRAVLGTDDILRRYDALDFFGETHGPRSFSQVWMVYTRYGNLVNNAAEAGRFEAYMNAQGITLADALKEMAHMYEAARRDAFFRPRNSTASNGQDHGDQQGQHIRDAELTDGEDTVIAPPVPVLPPNPITWGVDTRVCVECVSRVLESQFDRWWVRERAKGLLDREEDLFVFFFEMFVLAPDPLAQRYGRECRTQAHSPSHATRYNVGPTRLRLLVPL